MLFETAEWRVTATLPSETDIDVHCNNRGGARMGAKWTQAAAF